MGYRQRLPVGTAGRGARVDLKTDINFMVPKCEKQVHFCLAMINGYIIELFKCFTNIVLTLHFLLKFGLLICRNLSKLACSP